jgi:hypothetical protein
MLDERLHEIIPLSTHAFKHAQGNIATVRSKNVGNLILFRDGTLRRIHDVSVLGPDGDGFISQALSYVTRSWRIVTALSEPIATPFEDLRARIANLVQRDTQRPSPYLDRIPPHTEVALLVDQCESACELFDRLGIPSPEDALDILC